METPKETTLRALGYLRSDETARAKFALAKFTPEQMHQQHGESGRTRQEILDTYHQRDREADAAIAWVESHDD